MFYWEVIKGKKKEQIVLTNWQASELVIYLFLLEHKHFEFYSILTSPPEPPRYFSDDTLQLRLENRNVRIVPKIFSEANLNILSNLLILTLTLKKREANTKIII